MILRTGYHKKHPGKSLFSMFQKKPADKNRRKIEERSLMDTELICELLIVLLYIIKIILH